MVVKGLNNRAVDGLSMNCRWTYINHQSQKNMRIFYPLKVANHASETQVGVNYSLAGK